MDCDGRPLTAAELESVHGKKRALENRLRTKQEHLELKETLAEMSDKLTVLLGMIDKRASATQKANVSKRLKEAMHDRPKPFFKDYRVDGGPQISVGHID